MINTYWVMAVGKSGNYSYIYYPSVKVQGSNDDAQPPKPNFEQPIKPGRSGQLELPTGEGESQLNIIQVTASNKPPVTDKAPLAAELVLYGIVAKTLDGTSRLNPFYSATLGAAAVEVAVNSSRGTSLVFAHMSGGLVTQLYCSPDPVITNPGSW